MYYSWKGLCSAHGNAVVIRELSLYPQSLLAELTVLQYHNMCVRGGGGGVAQIPLQPTHLLKVGPAKLIELWPLNYSSLLIFIGNEHETLQTWLAVHDTCNR